MYLKGCHLSVERVKEFLSDSYWASDRPIEIIEKTLINSFCYGVYLDRELVSFARVVSDYATNKKHPLEEVGV